MYERAISLGWTCEPAFHMRRCQISYETMPFDFGYTPFHSLRKCLETRFATSFKKGLAIQCMSTGLQMMHEPERIFEESREKFARRAERFLACAHDKLLFVRLCPVELDSKLISEWETLSTVLRQTGFEGFRLLLVVREIGNTAPTGHPGIVRFSEPPDDPGELHWQGCHREWEQLFASGMKE